jgi:hypothetical protein
MRHHHHGALSGRNSQPLGLGRQGGLGAILEQVVSTKLPDLLRVERAPALAVTRLLSDGHRSEMWRWFASLDEAGRRAASRIGAGGVEDAVQPPPPSGSSKVSRRRRRRCTDTSTSPPLSQLCAQVRLPPTQLLLPTPERHVCLSVCLTGGAGSSG